MAEGSGWHWQEVGQQGCFDDGSATKILDQYGAWKHGIGKIITVIKKGTNLRTMKHLPAIVQ